jgi:hypothetical protein
MVFALALVLAVSASDSDCRSVTCTVNAVAQGDLDAAKRTAALGRPGLWALHEAAKNQSGEARGHLFAAIGDFASEEAEWALTMELKGGDQHGRAGAIRGLAKRGRATNAVLRAAQTDHPVVREAAAQYLFALGETGAIHAARMLATGSDTERALALTYVLRAEANVLSASIFRIAELARSMNAQVAELAVSALAKNGGTVALLELASIVSDSESTELAWRRAGETLAGLGAEGRRELIGAIGRMRDETRKIALSELAANGATKADVEAMVELLDDPSADRRAAAKVILARTGALGKEVARARLSSALPELEAAIRELL